MIDARLQAPRLADGRVWRRACTGSATTFPKEDFFGLGPDSSRDNEVIYGLRNTVRRRVRHLSPDTVAESDRGRRLL